MVYKRSILFALLICLVSVSLVGCNEEKAEAVKVAAETFRIESIAALKQVRGLFQLSLALPSVSDEDRIESVAEDLNAESEITPQMLDLLLTEEDVGIAALSTINEEFDEIERAYYQFETMFRSLKEGSYFAKNAVKKAEFHAINLTVQMINFATLLREVYPVQFTGRRVLILEVIAKAKEIDDSVLRMQHLRLIAQDLTHLARDERKAKHETILQCYRAAEAGKVVAELIRNYGSMSTQDILVSTRSAFDFIAEISGGDQQLTSLATRFDAVLEEIKSDPYWKLLLDATVVGN